MKAKSLSALALVALVGAGVAAPSAASAEAKSQPSSGVIKFKVDETPEEIVDPETDGKIDETDETDDVKPNPDRGSFSIDAVTDYNFDEHNVGVMETDPVYNALPAKAALIEKDGTKKMVDRGHFIQFTDKRATQDHGYTVSAQLTEQFAVRDAGGVSTGVVLNGARLNFSNAVLTSKTTTDSNLFPTPKTAFELAPAADGVGIGISVPVVENKAAGTGMGTYSLEFGTNEAGTDGESVKLTVPKTNLLTENEYKAVITWSIAEVPTV